MFVFQKYNFMNDLSNILIGLQNHKNRKYLFYSSHDFETEDVFGTSGLLLLFLYNKQKYITKYCQQYLPKHYIKLIFENTDYANSYLNHLSGYMFINISIESNISNTQDYYNFLKFVALLIVHDENIQYQNNIMNLDALLNQFVHDCKARKFIPKTSHIKSD